MPRFPPLNPILLLFHPKLHKEQGNRFHTDQAPPTVGGRWGRQRGRAQGGAEESLKLQALKCRCVSPDRML